jgi:hypothetical protein
LKLLTHRIRHNFSLIGNNFSTIFANI